MYDLKLLRYLEVLLEECSVSRAAARLNLTQPAMSHALARLRGLFGDPLLLKGHGRMTPTSRALQLREKVHALLLEAEQLTKKPDAFSPATSRAKFTIMSAEFVEYLLAPKLISALKTEAPKVEVQFYPADRELAPTWFERGKIDFRLGWWPGPPQTLRYKVLFQDRLVCIARQNHPATRHGLFAEDFLRADHVRIQSPRTGVSEHAVDRAAAALHRRLHVAVRVQSALTLAQAVAGSDLLAVVPERFARSLSEKFPLKSFRLPLANIPNVRIAMYWHERTHQDPAHRWFRHKLEELVKSL